MRTPKSNVYILYIVIIIVIVIIIIIIILVESFHPSNLDEVSTYKCNIP